MAVLDTAAWAFGMKAGRQQIFKCQKHSTKYELTDIEKEAVRKDRLFFSEIAPGIRPDKRGPVATGKKFPGQGSAACF